MTIRALNEYLRGNAEAENIVSQQFVLYKPMDIPDFSLFGGNETPFVQTSVPRIDALNRPEFRTTYYEGDDELFLAAFEKFVKNSADLKNKGRRCYLLCTADPVGLIENSLPATLCRELDIKMDDNQNWCDISVSNVSLEKRRQLSEEFGLNLDAFTAEELVAKLTVCGCMRDESDNTYYDSSEEYFLYVVLENIGEDPIIDAVFSLFRFDNQKIHFTRFDNLAMFTPANGQGGSPVKFNFATVVQPGEHIAIPLGHIIVAERPSEDGPIEKGYDIFSIGTYYMPERMHLTTRNGLELDMPFRAPMSSPVSYGEGLAGAG